MKRQRFLLGIALIALGLAMRASPALAQGDQVQLLLSRDLGYASGNEVEGRFTLAVAGPADILSVTYLIDGAEMATVTLAPFRYSWDTGNYAIGPHRLGAVVRTASGRTLQATPKDVRIVTAAEVWQGTWRVAGPIVGIVFLVMLVAIGFQFLAVGGNRRYAPGEHRNYGVGGGAICAKCHRPFALSIFNLHLGSARFARCPYCGKWALVRPASPAALLAAEQAEAEGGKPTVQEVSPEDLLRRQIEESKLSR